MNSMLYSSKTIETKYFLLSNLRSKKKFGGIVRAQEFGCSNYYGEEIKNPIYETTLKPSSYIPKIIFKPINLFNTTIKRNQTNKSVSLRESFKLILKQKNNKETQAKHTRQNLSTKRKNNLNILKIKFPYCKPTVNNTYTGLIVYNKNKDFIIAKNIEKNKKYAN